MRSIGIVGLALALSAAAGCVPPPAQPKDAEWKKVEVPAGGYAVTMPGTPKPITKWQGGLSVHFQMLEYSDYAYTTAYTDIPARATFDYDKGIKGACDAMNAVFVRQAPVKINGATGRQYVANIDKPVPGRVIGRIVLRNGRIYQMIIAGKNVTDDDVNTQKFFNSFEFTP